MKADEAPEKIYLEKNREQSGYYGLWKEEKYLPDDVEYTRTDAFIEKACKFIAPLIKDNSGGYDRKSVLNDFRKYMEG